MECDLHEDHGASPQLVIFLPRRDQSAINVRDIPLQKLRGSLIEDSTAVIM